MNPFSLENLGVIVFLFYFYPKQNDLWESDTFLHGYVSTLLVQSCWLKNRWWLCFLCPARKKLCFLCLGTPQGKSLRPPPQKCVSIIFCVGMFYMFFATTSSECFSFGELCVGFKQSNKVRLGGVKKMLHFCSAVLGEKKGDWATCQVFLFKNRLNVCQLGDCHLWYVVPPPLKQLECES